MSAEGEEWKGESEPPDIMTRLFGRAATPEEIEKYEAERRARLADGVLAFPSMPPFGLRASCPKCLAPRSAARPEFMPANCRHPSCETASGGAEHMIIVCACGYRWREKCADTAVGGAP
ncbi:MAG TPA: hypothetical protein VJN95_08910 [Gemmatimonadales bacterium]|nr:hypothetical protein [Gemmatimonadales bacterium]